MSCQPNGGWPSCIVCLKVRANFRILAYLHDHCIQALRYGNNKLIVCDPNTIQTKVVCCMRLLVSQYQRGNGIWISEMHMSKLPEFLLPKCYPMCSIFGYANKHATVPTHSFDLNLAKFCDMILWSIKCNRPAFFSEPGMKCLIGLLIRDQFQYHKWEEPRNSSTTLLSCNWCRASQWWNPKKSFCQKPLHVI